MAIPVRYNALSLLARPTSTVSSVGLIAIVIATFAYLQAVTDSAFETMTATGDPNTIVVISQSADSESVSRLGKDEINKLEMTADVERTDSGPIVSPELVAISSAYMRDDANVAVNAAVRGVDFDVANKVRHGRVKLIDGRVFNPGTSEVIVGEQTRKMYANHNIGDEIQAGARGMRKFKIVGVFSTGGTSADSEIWGYVETMRDVYGRSGYSSVRMIVPNQQAAQRAVDFIGGPEVGLTAKTERDYFSGLSTNQNTTQILSIAMIIIMGAAAAFAVANTMYAAVAGRVREIGMLRAIGFARASILTSFVIEGVLLSLLGGLLGAALSLLCNGMEKSILPRGFTTVNYSLSITPKILGTSLAVAVAIGLFGSIMPAWRAAKMKVTSALREA